MTGDELQQAAIELFGFEGWGAKLALALKVHRTQVWRWWTGRSPITGPTQVAIAGLLAEHRRQKNEGEHDGA